MNKTATKKKPTATLVSFQSLKDIDIPVTAKPAFNDLVLTTRDGAVQWLEANIRKARDEGAFMVDEVLTGAIARELLDRNPDNRPVSGATVSEMATAMRSEGFNGMNGETIKISVCGLLNDGQHRCHAKLESGVDIRTRFMFGLARESRLTIDQGKLRRSADFLAMGGREGGSRVAAVALLLYHWQQSKSIQKPSGTGKNRVRMGPSRMAEFAAANYEQIKRSVDAVPKDGFTQLGGFAIMAFAHLVFAEKDFAAATDFIERLVKGIELSEKSPILVCRQRLISGTRLRRHERFELILRAWNAWREGREAVKAQLRNNMPKIAS